jgi:glycosyltransferase involved in cell wall biosynthesis
VWLSRNFGQDAATITGMSTAGGDWIVTMDEDGQRDPGFIGAFLDTALAQRAAGVFEADQYRPARTHTTLRRQPGKVHDHRRRGRRV